MSDLWAIIFFLYCPYLSRLIYILQGEINLKGSKYYELLVFSYGSTTWGQFCEG